jgi:hypothetical protein
VKLLVILAEIPTFPTKDPSTGPKYKKYFLMKVYTPRYVA